ncbi:MAG TPA: DUF2795 domain-containing protein [Actinomadura sp.]|jgi:hypothetical protein|nr:DUF2795 domain-containing protein [Actinomadura sp.]
MTERLPTPPEVQRYLDGVDFPANRDQLMEHAQRQGAPQEVIEALKRIPNREYEGPAGIAQELGKIE